MIVVFVIDKVVAKQQATSSTNVTLIAVNACEIIRKNSLMVFI